MLHETHKAPKVDSATLRQRLQADETKNAHKRQFERHKLFAPGVLIMMNSSQEIDGMIAEISSGGLRFRPASSYIQERNSEPVYIVLDDLRLSGRIRATRADGYGVQVLDEMTEESLREILQKYGD